MAALRKQVRAIKQGDTHLFLTDFTAGELSNGFTMPDAWTPTNRRGYQRQPTQARFKKIAEYVTRKEGAQPLLPQAIVLNARNALKFTAGSMEGFGTLEIPDEALPLWEVDGQHRIGGIRRAVEDDPSIVDYPVPVVIAQNLDRLQEAVLFFVMNTRQQRVPTDLAQRIISEEAKDPVLREKLITEGKIWIEKAVEVVDRINDLPDHPWSGMIGVPGMKQRGTILRQVSYVQSLKPILAVEGQVYGTFQPELLARLLVGYWQALGDVFPAALSDPSTYVIQKTVGVFPLHAIAPIVFEHARTRNGKISREGMTEVLSEMAENLREKFNPEEADPSYFWMSHGGEAGNYAGAKGFKILMDHLKDALPKRDLVVIE
jgi:DGQHR domain-containing protein